MFIKNFVIFVDFSFVLCYTCHAEKVLIGGENMSRVCEICGRGKMTGKKVSHAENKTNRTFELNLQEVTIDVNGKPTKVKACTKCIKTARKAK